MSRDLYKTASAFFSYMHQILLGDDFAAEEAAEDNDVYAEAILGYSYYTGTELFTEKDYNQAFGYLTRAVRNSNFEYQEDQIKASIFRCLAGSYRYGRGCEPDQSLASYYTEQAAKYGDEGSKRATGIIRKEL